MTTNAYAAKRALFTYLGTLTTPPGNVLAGTTERPIVVSYDWPTEPGLRCVYGGGVRFDHREQVAEGPGLVVAETANVSVYMRCVERPACSAEVTDEQCADLGIVLAAAIRTDPSLGGSGFRVLGISGGIGDYHRNDDETVSTLAYSVAVLSNFGYGVLAP